MSPSRFHRQCLAEIVKTIKALNPPGFQLDEIKVRRQGVRKEGNGTWKCHRGITVHPEPERQEPGTNRSEDIGYGCGVTFLLGADHSEQNIGYITDARELVRRKFINQRLPNVKVVTGHVCTSTVEHGDFAKDFDDHQWEIGTLLIRVWARETRS
jgi:hypothetical protein